MSEKLLPCRCGSAPYHHVSGKSGKHWNECTGPSCFAETPMCDTRAEADAAWNRMQSPETFTREQAVEFGRWLRDHPMIEHVNGDVLDAFLVQWGK